MGRANAIGDAKTWATPMRYANTLWASECETRLRYGQRECDTRYANALRAAGMRYAIREYATRYEQLQSGFLGHHKISLYNLVTMQ